MKSASSLLDQRTGRHQEQAHKVIYSSMAAAPTEQPEMTELAPNPLRDCVAPVAVAAQLHSATSFMQAEAEPSSREQHPIEKPASSQEVQTSTSTPEATTASMYPVTSARSNGDGTVRGANNSTDSVPKLGDVNTDIAAEPQAHPDASASTTDVPFTTPTKQDGVITTMTSSNPMERESQEKGDQVTLELVGANQATYMHVDDILTRSMILFSCCFPDHGKGSSSRPPQRLTKCWLGHSKIGHQVRYQMCT